MSGIVLRCIFLQSKFKSTKSVWNFSFLAKNSEKMTLNILQQTVKRLHYIVTCKIAMWLVEVSYIAYVTSPSHNGSVFHNNAVNAGSVADKALGMISAQVLFAFSW